MSDPKPSFDGQTPTPLRRLQGLVTAQETWFAALLLLALALRLVNFTHPPDNAHEWRQTQTLLYSRGYADGASWLRPTISWNGLRPQVAVLEFPIYSVLVYLLGQVTSLLTAARILSLGSGLVAIAAFDRLLATLQHPRRRTAVVLFALAPVVIFTAHSAQPESVLLASLLVGSYATARAFRSRRPWPWLSLAGTTIALSGSIKPMVLLVLIPPLAYDGWRTNRLAQAGAVAVAGLVATGAWSEFARSTLLTLNPQWYFTNTRPEWFWGDLALRWNPAFYLTILTRTLVLLLPAGAAIGLVLAASRRLADNYWWLWLLGGLTSILIFGMLNYVHFYYQLDLVPGLAAVAGAAAPRWPRRLVLQIATAVLVAVSSTPFTLVLLQEDPTYMDAGQALASVTPKGRTVVVLTDVGAGGGLASNPYFPSVLYYADRPGWDRPLHSAAESIAALPNAPCSMAILYDNRPVPPPEGWHLVTGTAKYAIAVRSGC